MGKILNQLKELSQVCNDEMQREMIEEMIMETAEYVHVVAHMETLNRNFYGRDSAEKRGVVEAEDHHRSKVHEGMMSSVKSINDLCVRNRLPLIYTGDSERRHYGDFALALVKEIFEERK